LHLSTDPSKSYNHQSKTNEFYIIPEPDDSIDFVFSQSLFSHLLEREARNYLAESFRLMKPGGCASHSFFLIDRPPPTMGDRHTFSHKLGNVHVESLEPEAAVAYNSEFVTNLAKEVGFTRAAFRYEHAQPVLICRKDV
jgi:predicted SAM-dependent methyltransferase